MIHSKSCSGVLFVSLVSTMIIVFRAGAALGPGTSSNPGTDSNPQATSGSASASSAAASSSALDPAFEAMKRQQILMGLRAQADSILHEKRLMEKEIERINTVNPERKKSPELLKIEKEKLSLLREAIAQKEKEIKHLEHTAKQVASKARKGAEQKAKSIQR